MVVAIRSNKFWCQIVGYIFVECVLFGYVFVCYVLSVYHIDQRITPMALRTRTINENANTDILVVLFSQNRSHQNENLLSILLLLC